MTKQEVLSWIRKTKIVPVVRAGSAAEAIEAAGALVEGGIDILEMTMTVPNAIEVIRQVAKSYEGIALVGAGTVLDRETAKACVDAGAQFIVSPAFDLATVEFCQGEGIVVTPGALTPTEILTAWKAGADVVKIFPCDAMGGPSYVKFLKTPLPQIPLMPTGGVTLENTAAFLAAGSEAVGAGTNLVDVKLLRDGNRAELVARARAFCVAAGNPN